MRWKKIALGYEREDGKLFSLTPTTRKPTWVSESYYIKTAKRIAKKR